MYGSSTVGFTVFCFFLRRRYRSSSVAIITTAKIAAADAMPALAPLDKLDCSSSGDNIELPGVADVIKSELLVADMTRPELLVADMTRPELLVADMIRPELGVADMIKSELGVADVTRPDSIEDNNLVGIGSGVLDKPTVLVGGAKAAVNVIVLNVVIECIVLDSFQESIVEDNYTGSLRRGAG
jgi:hypothetical protein